MQRQNVEDLAVRFLSAWNAGGSSVVEALGSPDLVVSYPHFSAPINGPAAFREVLEQTHASFPDLEIEPEHVLVEGEQAVIFWTYRGTHEGGEIFGIHPEGRRVRVSGVSRYRVADGRVTEETGVVDNLSLMLQLGAGRTASS